MSLKHWEPEAWATVLLSLAFTHALRFCPDWPWLEVPAIDTRKWGWLDPATIAEVTLEWQSSASRSARPNVNHR